MKWAQSTRPPLPETRLLTFVRRDSGVLEMRKGKMEGRFFSTSNGGLVHPHYHGPTVIKKIKNSHTRYDDSLLYIQSDNLGGKRMNYVHPFSRLL